MKNISCITPVYFNTYSRLLLLILVGISALHTPIFSQNLSPLAEDFLEGLPPAVREEIEVQNEVEKEDQLEKLFRSDASVGKNKVICEY